MPYVPQPIFWSQPATPKQIRFLRELGFQELPTNLTKGQARQMIEETLKRNRQNAYNTRRIAP